MSGPSQTALLISAYRARATSRANPLCVDPYAARLAGSDGFALADRYDRIYAAAELYTAVRTAFIDGETVRATHAGTTQVVLLGAGLDTRAARLAREGVRFFEVDQPSSQADKLARLGALGDYPADAATHVACNFETDDFLERLGAAGFSPSVPAFFIWEGVTPYLTETAVRATLRRIATGCARGTEVVFDYFSRKLVERRSANEADHEIVDWLAELGEPLRFGINHVIPLLHEEGFRRARTLTFDEACLNLTGTYDRTRQFRFQHLAVAGT